MPPPRPLSPGVGGEGKGEGPAPAEPALVTRANDLLLWLIQHAGQLPRAVSFPYHSFLQVLRCPVVDSIWYGIV
jgi:hypothetical protein